MERIRSGNVNMPTTLRPGRTSLYIVAFDNTELLNSVLGSLPFVYECEFAGAWNHLFVGGVLV